MGKGRLSDKPVFIGLAGTLNAGKDALSDVLESDYGFLHVSTSDMLREIKRREFGDAKEALLLRNDPFINDLRKKRGPGFLIEIIHKEWESQKDQHPGGYVASGIRAIGEAEAVVDHGGFVVFVDADVGVRHKRAISRRRDANDEITLEQFIAMEQSEIDVDPDDRNVQNLGAMKSMANLVIDNNQPSVEEFELHAIHELQSYLNSPRKQN